MTAQNPHDHSIPMDKSSVFTREDWSMRDPALLSGREAWEVNQDTVGPKKNNILKKIAKALSVVFEA